MKLLIVESHSSALLRYAHYAEVAGLTPLLASDVDMAYCSFEQENPNIVLIDAHFVHHHQYHILKYFRDNDKNKKQNFLPILIMYDSSDCQDILFASTFGWVDYLLKPITGSQLLAKYAIIKQRIKNNQKTLTAHQEKTQSLMHTIQTLRSDLSKRNSELVYVNQQLHKLARQEQYIATHDTITHLPNRKLFNEKLRARMQAAKDKEGDAFALLFLELEGITAINDSLGHHIVDQLLEKVSKRIVNTLHPKDVIARFSSNEFAIIYHKLRRHDDAGLVAALLLKELNEPFSLTHHELLVIPHIGIALYPDNGTDEETLSKNADAALHVSQFSNTRYCYFTEDMNAAALHKMEMSLRLAHALRNNEFTLHYQPQLNLATHQLIGVEALLRWEPKNGPPIPPNDFIPVAEETGIIQSLGNWIIHAAIAQFSQWQQDNIPIQRLSVNLSARQVDQTLIEEVSGLLNHFNIPPACLELELTEREIMRNTDNIYTILRQLSDLGVRIAIDDFGTGYSSLSYLSNFPVNVLKVDRAFVQDIHSSTKSANLVMAIINMAHSLELDVVAEGVENKEQERFLLDLNCTIMQGYLYSRPLEPESLRHFLEKKNIAKMIRARPNL